jgi:acyl phosphate:glycerol-3-phosphate acyltransferase
VDVVSEIGAGDAGLIALLSLASYLLGSIPTGVLFARARGVDIRAVGSGNIGATNVARSLGKKLGAVVLVLDALKGALPVLVVQLAEQGGRLHPMVLPAVGLAAIVGHCFPVWLRFRGGKGVATTLGVFLAADPLVAAIGVGIWVLLYAVTRISSIGSMVTARAFPILLFVLGRDPPLIALGVLVAVVILAKHQGNLRRLLRRQELKV